MNRPTQTKNQTSRAVGGGPILRLFRPIILTITLTVFLTGCLKNSPTLEGPLGDTDTPPIENLSTVDADTLTSGFITERQTADAMAKAWHADSVIYAMTVSWPPNLAEGRDKRVYVYGSATAPQVWWTVGINEQTDHSIPALIPRKDYLGTTLPAMQTAYWSLNPVQALQIAEEKGGKEFREDNPGAEVTASLAQQGPNNWLWWVVSYRGNDTNQLRVRIHPQSGVVYDEQGQELG